MRVTWPAWRPDPGVASIDVASICAHARRPAPRRGGPKRRQRARSAAPTAAAAIGCGGGARRRAAEEGFHYRRGAVYRADDVGGADHALDRVRRHVQALRRFYACRAYAASAASYSFVICLALPNARYAALLRLTRSSAGSLSAFDGRLEELRRFRGSASMAWTPESK